MQLRAIRFELRLVGDGTDQRMPERVLGLRVERCLVDQLRGDEVVQNRLDLQSASACQVLNRDPITAAAFSVRLAAGSRRSMRAAITACNVLGTLTSAAGSDAQIAAAAADQHVALAQVPDDLLGEEGIARRALGDELGESGHRPVLAQQFSTQRRHLRLVQRLKRDRLRSRRMCKRANVFRPVGDQHK